MTNLLPSVKLGGMAERADGIAYFMVDVSFYLSMSDIDLSLLYIDPLFRKNQHQSKDPEYFSIPYEEDEEPIINSSLFSDRSNNESSQRKKDLSLYGTKDPDLLSAYSVLRSLEVESPADMQASVRRADALPHGQVMAVISEQNGVYRVEQGYIPGKSPAATMGTRNDLSRLKRPISLQTVVQEATAFESETGVPVVIRPNPLVKMQGSSFYPPNGYDSVSLYALDKPLEQRISQLK
ncbi:MAG: hypothetical protein EPN86_01080 [Nanoarchaeota archaeon]|nr:MAG: hypothetical protein EPN86_01080 [Nanoarchaeota archaeon]